MIDRPRITVTHAHLCSRRTLTSLAAAGVGAPLLAACSGDDATATDSGSGGGSDDESSSSAPAETESSAAAAALTGTADIEVGGGTIFPDEEVVVTQPTAGEFKGFSAICTHQGCVLASVSDGTINCDCHGSKFSIEDGSPQSGPASAPLGEVSLTVDGDQISLA